eukprot:SAG11_NODE_25439_length_358_cov_1.992278_1_plen_62_part_00
MTYAGNFALASYRRVGSANRAAAAAAAAAAATAATWWKCVWGWGEWVVWVVWPLIAAGNEF